MCALGNRKNVLFNEVLAREGIAPYPGSAATLDLLERIGMPAAIVSSSKNARPVLEAAGLSDRFDVVIDGIEVASRGLPGKPAPDAYLLGAECSASTCRRRSSSRTRCRASPRAPPATSPS